LLRKAAALAVVFAATPYAAFAHAYLAQSAPSADASVSAPVGVSLTFSQTLEKNFSNVEVHDAGGHRVDDGKPGPDGGPTALAIGLPKLPPGRYQVIWHATSVDTHRTEGNFYFTIVP